MRLWKPKQRRVMDKPTPDEPLAEWEETLLREDRWLATIWPTYPNGRLRSDEHNLKLARSIMALADAEVAAAVAAVRADLAAEVAARVGYGPTEEFRSGYDQAIRWAAATIRGGSDV